MEYIYTADADEVLDDENWEQFRLLKEAMVPEVEIVQMKYVTKNEFNTVLNFKEYRRSSTGDSVPLPGLTRFTKQCA